MSKLEGILKSHRIFSYSHLTDIPLGHFIQVNHRWTSLICISKSAFSDKYLLVIFFLFTEVSYVTFIKLQYLENCFVKRNILINRRWEGNICCVKSNSNFTLFDLSNVTFVFHNVFLYRLLMHYAYCCIQALFLSTMDIFSILY